MRTYLSLEAYDREQQDEFIRLALADEDVVAMLQKVKATSRQRYLAILADRNAPHILTTLDNNPTLLP